MKMFNVTTNKRFNDYRVRLYNIENENKKKESVEYICVYECQMRFLVIQEQQKKKTTSK